MKRRELVDELRQDTQLAIRLFQRSPMFFAATVLTLALGIGANGAVFSILQAALLQPLPYRDPSELVILERTRVDQARSAEFRSARARALSAPMLVGWRREGTSQLGEVAAMLPLGNGGPLDMAAGDRAQRLRAAAVTPNFFHVLGVRAARGRVFADDDEANADPIILLSDALWRRDFGRDPTIVGRAIVLTGGASGSTRGSITYTVAGVLPRGFHFTYPDEIEAWVVLPWSELERESGGTSFRIAFTGVARLKPGVSLAQARQRAADLPDGRSVSAAQRRRDGGYEIGLVPIRDWVIGETRPSLELLGAVAALLLLITCVTVSNGLLAHVAERRQELAVRAALGARRSRLVRQLLTEGALLSASGALAGTILAALLQPALRVLLPASVPRVGELSVNAYIVAFGAAMAAVTTILAAVAPALGGTRLDPAAMLSRAGSAASAGRSTLWWRHGLVAAQAAMATALLISASLLLTSFWRLGRVPLGYDGDQVVTVELQLLDFRYAVSRGVAGRFQDDLMARVRTIPGIEDVAVTSAVPFRGFDPPVDLPVPGVGMLKSVPLRTVDPAYFRVMRIPAVRGRLLDENDREAGPPVAVISESLARLAFGSGNPIGRKIGSDPVTEVVGVVADPYYANLEKDPAPTFYIPRSQNPRVIFSLVARTTATASMRSVVPAIRRAIRDLDPTLPAMNFTTVGELVDASVANRRFYTVATVAFAAMALLLTTAGLVVVIARVVAERRRELAIRAALGATRSVLVRTATSTALMACGVGVVVGLAGAFSASGVLRQFLFNVAPRSPVAYSAVAVLVLSVAVLAAWAPVRRFDRTPLVTLLKAE